MPHRFRIDWTATAAVFSIDGTQVASRSIAIAGTQAAPFRTLNRGVSVLTPGDTLRVGVGTYDETLIDNIPSGTSWSSPVTVTADDPNNRPVIQPTSSGEEIVSFQGAQRYIEFSGFVINGVNVGHVLYLV